MVARLGAVLPRARSSDGGTVGNNDDRRGGCFVSVVPWDETLEMPRDETYSEGSLYRPISAVRTGSTVYRYADRSPPGGTLKSALYQTIQGYIGR